MSLHEMISSITCTGCKHGYDDSALFCPNCGRPKVRETQTDALLGKVLGERFQVHELLGQGASGTIYRAEHVTLRRRVAIKVLHDELSRDDLAVERFRREATTVAEIDNEHIVEIHDFGRTPDGRLYLAMELLEGETLDSVLAREKQLSVERAADVLIQVGEALMEAHAIGYVHRDLRPRNVYLAVRRGKANFIKLLDFGLAKLVETDASAASTSLGMTFGDPRYMSPEQARGDRIDRRADIYQLGCVAYEMLTGAPPFSGNRVFDILTKQVTEIPQPLPTRRPGVPLWMEAAVAKMLAKDPENRFATTTRMVEALRRGLETGEVMEDEVARRRESIPPPSVSRVMQRMGITGDALPQAKASEPRGLPPAVAKASDAKPDSVELLRKRTGTPQLGVPVVAAADPSQAPRAGEIERKPSEPPVVLEPPRKRPATDEPSVRLKTPGGPSGPVEGRVRPPTGPVVAEARLKRPTADPGISQVWYDEGDDDTGGARRRRAQTDSLLYDDDVPRSGRKKGLIIAVLGTVAVIGGVAFALSRGGGSSTPAAALPTPAVAETPAAIVDAMPSTIISETPDAAVARPADPVVANKPDLRKPVVLGVGTRRVPDVVTGFVPPGGEDLRRPGGDPPVVIKDPPKDPPKDPVPVPVGAGSGSGINGGPQDPYNGGGAGSDTPTDAPVEKKAEFYASLGQQQLTGGDIASAASSFKKALEIDGNNLAATIGMGEIAVRQGSNGDAIVHLKKAAKLAPKSSRVFTLLGDAYLNSGNNKEAATNYKKALQIDPDNTRARDGYNEAQNRQPPEPD